MKKIIISITVFIGLSAFFISDEKVFKKLYALEGTWKMTTKRGAIYEEWKKVNNNYLQSKGYLIKGADTIINERIALKNTSEGIFYISTVEDQNYKTPVSFKMTKSANSEFVFENSQHDFPKRIVYKLINKDSLYAFVDDGTDAPAKRQNFCYKKIK